MNKEPDRKRPRHSNARSSSHYYQTVERLGDGASLDAAIERQVRHQWVRRELLRMQEKLLTALGDRGQLFHDYDTLLTAMQTERERAWFDLGCEYGLREAHAQDYHGSAGLDEEAAEFAAGIRARLLETGLSDDRAILGLLECLWGVVAGRDRSSRG